MVNKIRLFWGFCRVCNYWFTLNESSLDRQVVVQPKDLTCNDVAVAKKHVVYKTTKSNCWTPTEAN